MELKQLLGSYVEAVRAEGLTLYSVSLSLADGEEATAFLRSDDAVCLYSAAKTVTSIAVGYALREGLFALDDAVLAYFSEFQAIASPGGEAIRVRDLLTMSTGKRCFWFGAEDREMEKTDWAELFWRGKQREEPGRRFFYSNAASYMLARLIQKRSGLPLREYLMPRLFTPLGIVNPLWGTCPRGYQNGASQLYLRHDEFKRLGTLLLHQGLYAGTRLIDQSYFQMATSFQMATTGLPISSLSAREVQSLRSGYGFHCWLGAEKGSFRADGKYGQFLAVYPRQGLLVTIMGHEEARPYRALSLIEEMVLPALASADAET